MSTRGRSASPQSRDVDVDMDKQSEDKLDAKVIVITNLTRNARQRPTSSLSLASMAKLQKSTSQST